jgi:hypothetical protein
VDGGFDELAGGVDVLGSRQTPPTTTPSGQSGVDVGVGVSDDDVGGTEDVGVD